MIQNIHRISQLASTVVVDSMMTGLSDTYQMMETVNGSPCSAASQFAATFPPFGGHCLSAQEFFVDVGHLLGPSPKVIFIRLRRLVPESLPELLGERGRTCQPVNQSGFRGSVNA